MTTKQHRMRCAFAALTNAGGEGKTWTSMVVHSLFELLGEPIVVADADQGNRAARVIFRNVYLIDITEDPETSTPKLMAQVTGAKSLLIDSGANALASSVNFNNVLADSAEKLREEGYKTYGLCVLSANKPGAAKALERNAKRFSPFYEILWVFNDRDGSDFLPEGFVADITVPHLHPGFVTLVNAAGGFTSVVRDGIEGHQLSSDYIAAYLWRFANQGGVRKLFGDAQIDSLRPVLDRPFKRVDPLRIARPQSDEEYLNRAWEAEIMRAIWPCLGDVDAMIEALVVFKKARA